MAASFGFVLLVIHAAAAAPPVQRDVPRLVVKIERARAGVVRFALTNVAATEATVKAQAYLALIQPEVAGDQPLSRVVAPGSYRVQLQIKDERGNWWRSNELSARVRPSGAVNF